MKDKALLTAIESGDLAAVEKRLKKGGNPDSMNDLGYHVLSSACWYENPELIRLLVKHGADPECDGGLPLYHCVSSPNLSRPANLLALAESKVDLNRSFAFQSDIHGSALMVALFFGKLEIAEALLDLGVDVKLKNQKGDSAFTLAVRENYGKFAKALLSKGAKPNPKRKYELEFAAGLGGGKPIHDNHLERRYSLVPAKTGKHSTGNPDLSGIFDGATFPYCKNPPVHLLTLKLSEIPGLPEKIRELRTLHVIHANCDCDGVDYLHFRIGKGGKLTHLPVEEEDWNTDPVYCTDAYRVSPGVTPLALVSPPPEDDRGGIHLGGMPPWVQDHDWGVCRECGENGFYLGYISQYRVPPGAEGAGHMVYFFVCADCRELILVRQMT